MSLFEAVLITGGLPVRKPSLVGKGTGVTRDVYVTYGVNYNEAPTFFIGEVHGDGVVRVSSHVWNDFEEANHALYHGCYSYVWVNKHGEERHTKPMFNCNDANF